jgi:hypothetical protein
MDDCIIYDFETLGNQYDGVVISLAVLRFNENNYALDPYNYDDLVEQTGFIKFNVEEQVKKYNRKIEQTTLKWWDQQTEQAKEQLKPSPSDASISDLWNFMTEYTKGMNDIRRVYTRGNMFDPVLMEKLLYSCDKGVPYPWWNVRDTRSFLDGLLWGSDIDNKFMPDGCAQSFIHHDPRHDIALDVMRMQTVVRAL